MNKTTDNRLYDTIARVIDYLGQHHHEQPDLDTLANIAHMSPTHFQKVFSSWVGISPKRFIQHLNLQDAKQHLSQQASILTTSETVGLSSTSRLHDLFVNIEAMTPAEYKNKGKNLCITYHFYETLFGEVLHAETHRGTCFLHFIHDKDSALQQLRKSYPNAEFIHAHTENRHCLNAVNLQHTAQGIRIHAPCSHFQLKVWRALLDIPYGQTRYYGDIAKQIGNPKAARAVGTAIANNPIAYLIPCHRVIPSTSAQGSTGEYRWGKERKKAMICTEQI